MAEMSLLYVQFLRAFSFFKVKTFLRAVGGLFR